MTKESSSLRKCSHCGQNGHNSRTCNNNNNGGKGCSFKLFGVRIDPNQNLHHHGKEKEEDHHHDHANGGSIRKTKSMGNLQACSSVIGNNSNHDPSSSVDHGYLSDGLLDRSKETNDRKKGVPWSEEEHQSFLIGLKKMGKGDWRGISKNYVPSRTPTQVASHAQKYFIRQNAAEKRRRRSSLFDMPLKQTISSPTSSVLTSNKAPAVSLKATTSAAPVASVRPPISPVPRTYGIQNFQYVPYMVGYPSNTLQTFGNAKCMPTLSFVPMLNYPNQTCVYPLNGHGNGSIAVTSPFMSQSSTSLLPQALPITLPNGSSEAGLATAVPKRDGLEASIGALSL